MPNFFGGLAEGAAGLPDEIGKLLALKKLNEAKTANFNALAAQGGGGAPGGPQPAPPPAAALAAIGKPSTPPMPARPPMAGPAPQPQAGPPQPPPGQPQGTGGANDPTGMAANPNVTDPWKEGQSILTNMVQNLKRANPKADPKTLADALDMQIDEVKGITPTTKAYMGAQVGMLKQQADLQFKMSKLQSENDYHMKYLLQKGLTAQQVEAERERHDKAVEGIWSDREDAYQESVDYQHQDRQASTAARIDVANIGASSRMSVAQLRERGLDDRAIAALKGKHGATVSSGLAKVLAVNPGADVNQTIATLQAAYGDDGTGGGSSAPAKGGNRGGGLKPGTVEGGYRYKGGDPSKPSSWTKL